MISDKAIKETIKECLTGEHSELFKSLFNQITKMHKERTEELKQKKLELEEMNEEFIKKVYKALREKLGQHNHLVESKSMWKWCIGCKKKAITISQPTDPVTRFADYRILCLNCNTTQIIKSNQYSKKQELDSFISNLIIHFNLEIALLPY